MPSLLFACGFSNAIAGQSVIFGIREVTGLIGEVTALHAYSIMIQSCDRQKHRFLSSLAAASE